MSATTTEVSADLIRGTLPTGRARTLALVALLLASFMELLDSTIVNVALPRIEESLRARGPELQWMVVSYTLAFAVGLITGARLGDTIGRKRMFVAGLIGFTLCSALCGLALNPEMLIAARAAQGLASAAMIPQVLASIQVMYKPSERAAGLALFSALAGVASVSGPILGAVLTDADIAGLGWRSVFLVNVPVGIVAIVAAIRLVPESTSPIAHRLDVVGVVTLAAGLLALLYPLTVGADQGWPVWTWASIAIGVGLLWRFVVVQRREERAGGEPLVPLSLFRFRAFAAGLALLALFFIPMTGYLLVQTLFLQLGLGYSTLDAGLTMLPFAIAVPVLAGLSATVLVKRFGRLVLVLAPILTAVGFTVLGLTAALGGASVTSWQLVPGLLLAGAGFGMLVGPIGIFVLGQVPVAYAGAASGIFNTTSSLSSAIGAAVLGTVFLGFAKESSAGPGIAFQEAFVPSALIMAGIVLVSGVAAFFLPKRPILDDQPVG